MKFIALTVLFLFFAGVCGMKLFNKSSLVEKVEVSTPVSSPSTTVNSITVAVKTIEKHQVDKSRVLYLNDQVQFPLVTELVNKLKELNAKSSEPIWLLIDSPGGSVLDGATLISEIEASKAPVFTVCTRLCASMAAMIHSYGTKRFSTDRAILMYHPASGGAQGQVPNMLSQLTSITKFLQRMVDHEVSRSKMSATDFANHVAYEFWVESEDAVQLGLDDSIINLNVPSYEARKVGQSDPEEEHVTVNKHKYDGVDFQWISPYLYLWNRQ